jgi:hypothetical protein
VRGFRFLDAARLSVGDVASESPRLVASRSADDEGEGEGSASNVNPFGRRVPF